jgi:hypothetical protein
MSESSQREMLKALAAAARDVDMDAVRASPYIGLILDESTDIANKPQIVFYYRYVFKGRAKTVFAGFQELPRGNAETVLEASLYRLRKDRIPVENVVSIGSDGCSTMMGRVGGVGARFSFIVPTLIHLHCACHREALACRDAAANHPYIEITFFGYLEQLGRFFKASAKRTQVLSEEQKKRQMPLTKVATSCVTRWLSQDKVTENVHLTLLPLLDALQRLSTGDSAGVVESADVGAAVTGADPMAAGLYATLCTEEWVGVLCLFRDVLPHLSQFSKYMQGELVDFTQLEIILPGIRKTLLGMIDGKNTQSFDARDAIIANLRKHGHAVKEPHPSRRRIVRDKDWVVRLKNDYIESLVSCIDDRFGYFEPSGNGSPGDSSTAAANASANSGGLPGNVEVLAAISRLFLLNKYPKEGAGIEEVAKHFDGALDTVAEHMGQKIPESKHVRTEKTIMDTSGMKEQFLMFYPAFSMEMRQREVEWVAEREAERNEKLERMKRRRSRARQLRGLATIVLADSDTSDEDMEAECPCACPDKACGGACECEVHNCEYCCTSAASRISASVTAAGLPMLEAIKVILTNSTIAACGEGVVKLCVLAAVICPTSVEAERGFSFLKLIKTPARNSLSAEVLDMMCYLAINAPPLQSEAADAIIERALSRFFFDRAGNKVPRRTQKLRARLDKTTSAVRPWSTDAAIGPHKWGWSFQDDPAYTLSIEHYRRVLEGNALKQTPPAIGEAVCAVPGANPACGGGELARGCFLSLGSMTVDTNDFIAYRWDAFGEHGTTWCAAKVLRSRKVGGKIVYRVRYDTPECAREERDHDLSKPTYGVAAGKSWVLLRAAPKDAEPASNDAVAPATAASNNMRQSLIDNHLHTRTAEPTATAAPG